jgi:hypothetical protein
MVTNQNRANEAEISMAVLRVAASRRDSVATYGRLRNELPRYVDLSPEDREQPSTRSLEEMWERVFGNIQSQCTTAENILSQGYAEHVPGVGYKITDSGRAYLKRKGF